jgi:transposase InsO family protein
VRLPAHTDTLHGTLSGPATKKLMERAWCVFDDAPYERLATISVAHLYNLRKRAGYVRLRQTWTKTRPVNLAIGERRAPAPNNRPGYLRLDSVHQGDQDGLKGVYHINAVDCLTQYEVVASCERISEAFLIPVLEELLLSFPFPILGFHVDNGSEYINHRVAALLNKLLIEEFTKSRSRHSNDNALVESKNGAIVRKHLGYSHIPQRFAAEVNVFCRDHLNAYVNFHRPCLFAETITDARGRERKRYPYKLMMTPYEKLKSLTNAEQFLKKGITFELLDAQAHAMSDNDAVQRLNTARAALFKTISNRSKSAA